MRLIVLAAATLVSAVATASTPPMLADQGAYEAPARPWSTVEQAERDRVCRDRIQHVRDTNGHPPLQRGTASPNEPLLMAAIDQRIDGCSVMVMRHDASDIRPLPKIENRPELIPAR